MIQNMAYQQELPIMMTKYHLYSSPILYISIKIFSCQVPAALVRAFISLTGVQPTHCFKRLEDDYISVNNLIIISLIFNFPLSS